MSGYADRTLSGLRFAIGNSGFIFRPTSTVAPYGFTYDDDNTRVIMDEVIHTPYQWVLDEGQVTGDTKKQCTELSIRAKSSSGKTKEESIRYFGNQHSILYRKKENDYIPTKTVFSWHGSASGDGPYILFNTFSTVQALNRYQQSEFGTFINQFQFTSFFNYGQTNPNYHTNDIYSFVRKKDLPTKPEVSSYSYWTEYDYYYSFFGNCNLYKNGKLWFGQEYAGVNPNDSEFFYFPKSNSTEIDEKYQYIRYSRILGVGPVSENRSLVIVCHVFDAYPNRNAVGNSTLLWRYKIRLYDLSVQREINSAKEVEYNNAVLIELPVSILFNGTVSLYPMPFLWDWRFSQDLSEFSGLYLRSTLSNDGETDSLTTSVVRVTFSILHDIQLDQFLITNKTESIYSPYIEDQSTSSGGASSGTREYKFKEEGVNRFPYALNYINNSLSYVWFSSNSGIESYSITETASWETGDFSFEFSHSGYLYQPRRGVRGTLEFDSELTIPLYLDASAEFYSGTYTTFGTVQGSVTGSSVLNAKTSLTPLYINIQANIGVVAARSQSLQCERSLNSWSKLSENSYQMDVTRKDTSGIVLYLYKNQTKSVLVDNRAPLNNNFTNTIHTGPFNGLFRPIEPFISPISPNYSEFGLLYSITYHHPLEGLIPGILPTGLFSEITIDSEFDPIRYLNLGNCEPVSYGCAYDPRSDVFLYSIDFGELNDHYIEHNLIYTDEGNTFYRFYSDFPYLKDRSVFNGLLSDKLELTTVLDEYIKTILGSFVSLYPIGLY